MKLLVLSKDTLELQGIRWMIESHISGVEVISLSSLQGFEEVLDVHAPDILVIDMDMLPRKEDEVGRLLRTRNLHWLGLSSERTFYTAYRALKWQGEDLLFRPYSPQEFIQIIQHLRFRVRNKHSTFLNDASKHIDISLIDYPDLFMASSVETTPLTMAAFITPNTEMLTILYDELSRFSFEGSPLLFVLSPFILLVNQEPQDTRFQDQCRAFFTYWKERLGEPLAIVVNIAHSTYVRDMYQQTRQMTELIFYEGFDILTVEAEPIQWIDLDPFLTPIEQRQWIEMLATRDVQAVREWMEHQFLTLQRPYPDPEMIRVRLTSVLAQVRRYMKAYNIDQNKWENEYHQVFQEIVRGPLIYDIVRDLIRFISSLLMEDLNKAESGTQSLVEKTRELIEANYWDAGWNLAACAESLRISKSTLSRRFSTESGKSFRETLHEVRIREAKRLLKETNCSLDEIAKLTGYSHSSYFSMKFKQLTKCSPSNFRTGMK